MRLALVCLLLSGCLSRALRSGLRTPLSDVFDRNLLTAVGLDSQKLPERYYDPELAIYLNQFLEDAKKRKVSIPTESIKQFMRLEYVDQLSVPADGSVMAACNRFYTQERTLGSTTTIRWTSIEVLRARIQEYVGNDPQKRLFLLREVLYHEFYHCFLNKGHLPASVDGIMNPTFSKGDERSLKRWQQLVDEMFSTPYMQLTPDVPF